MPHLTLAATLVLGFVLGLRHALDADHLAAVAAIVDARGGLRRSILTGLSWGLGHALTLFACGGVLVALRVAVPERIARLIDLAVGVMLVALGAMALAGALEGRLHAHAHEHGGERHSHLHAHLAAHRSPETAHEAAPAPPHRHPHPFRLALRPFLVGSLHGLAGTGALVLLVMTTVPTVLLGCLYLGIFGAGSVAGMALMSAVLGAPFWVARRRAAWIQTTLRGAAGLGSLGLGLLIAWRAAL